MKKVLYVNGCSHSCGAEISYRNSLREPLDLEMSWGGQIAKKYNLVHVNDAFSGQCNTAILSTTIQGINKLLQYYAPEEIFVIIGWSSFDRTYYIYNENKFMFVPGIHGTDGYKEWPRPVKVAFEHWVSGENKDDNMNRFSLIYESMTNLLKLNNINYFYFNSIQSVSESTKDFLNVIDNYNPSAYLFDKMKNDKNYLEPFNNEMSYYNYLRQRYDGHIGGRNHHFLSDAQSEWASILEEHIGKYLK